MGYLLCVYSPYTEVGKETQSTWMTVCTQINISVDSQHQTLMKLPNTHSELHRIQAHYLISLLPFHSNTQGHSCLWTCTQEVAPFSAWMPPSQTSNLCQVPIMWHQLHEMIKTNMFDIQCISISKRKLRHLLCEIVDYDAIIRMS